MPICYTDPTNVLNTTLHTHVAPAGRTDLKIKDYRKAGVRVLRRDCCALPDASSDIPAVLNGRFP